MQTPKCKEKNHFDRDITIICQNLKCSNKWGCQKCLSANHKLHIDNCVSVSEFEDQVDATKNKIRQIINMKFTESILILEEASKQLLKKIKDVIQSVQKAADIIQDQIFKELELFDILQDGFKNQNYVESLSNDCLNRVMQLILPQTLTQIEEVKQNQINQLTKYAESILEQVIQFQFSTLNEIQLGIKLKEFQEGEFRLAVKEYNSNNIGNCYLLTNGRLTKIGQYDNGLRSGMWSEVLYYNQYRDFSITFRGQYNTGLRVNQWLYYDQDQSIIGGGQYNYGNKINNWIEPEVFLGKWGKIIILHKGEYNEGVKNGDWWTFFANRGQVGGGNYVNGVKNGFWTEVEAYPGFLSSTGIIYQGEYINGIKNGLWLIQELNIGQIGGGIYSQTGLKEGLWTEVEVHVGVGCSIILLHVGDYKQGQKVGEWKILDITRNQIGGGVYKGYKKGNWIDIEVSIGWRCSQILQHKGFYKKGKKEGLWNTYKEGTQQIIAFGQYKNSLKEGKWTDIELFCGYFSSKTLIYTGDYKEGLRIGKWVISEETEGVIGGGTYSQIGEKELDWVDIELQVGWRCSVIIQLEGEYLKGKRNGLWITKLLKGNQLGGGCYNKNGFKEGGWKEVEIHTGVGKYLTLFHIGGYKNGIRVGTWAIQNENREKVSSGYYTKQGNKEGEWMEIQAHDGIEDSIILMHSGEYNDGLRVGNWKIENINRELIGGGQYSLSGKKEGDWQDVECHIGYNSEVILQLNGKYKNGIKQGLWKFQKMDGDSIGGGQYSEYGQKMGKWMDVDIRIGGGCQLILLNEGEYNNGLRVGQWNITQYGGKSINGGGIYNTKGYKDENWIEIIPHIGYCNLIILSYIGQYKHSTRIGKWIIKNQQEIGGGQYLINGLKDGKWIEIIQQYFDNLTICNGIYSQGHKLDEWEFVDKLLKDL